MYARAVLAGAVALVVGVAPVSGQNTGGQIERVVVNYNEDGMATITPAAVEGFLRALYAEQAAGGDFWKSGGFDFPIEFRKVEERIRAFLAIAFQGTKAAIFSAQELAALEARRADIEAALKNDWANVNLAAAGAPASQTSSVCAQLAARLRELAPQVQLEKDRARQDDMQLIEERESAIYFREVASRLHEFGRAGLSADELSAEQLEGWARQYNVTMTQSLRLSPYALYLTVASIARQRADWLSKVVHVEPATQEATRLQQQLVQNNCPKEPEP